MRRGPSGSGNRLRRPLRPAGRGLPPLGGFHSAVIRRPTSTPTLTATGTASATGTATSTVTQARPGPPELWGVDSGRKSKLSVGPSAVCGSVCFGQHYNWYSTLSGGWSRAVVSEPSMDATGAEGYLRKTRIFFSSSHILFENVLSNLKWRHLQRMVLALEMVSPGKRCIIF